MANNELLPMEEYQLEKKDIDLLSHDEDSIVTNLYSSYLKDISKYPLLSQEEEHKYALYLEKPENNKLLVFKTINGCKMSSLNIPLLFRSLCDCSSYRDITNDLLAIYSNLNSHSKDSDTVFRYQTESKKLNRALNKEELKKLFNINDGEILSEIELLNEVKKFINYKFAFDKLFTSNLRLVISNARMYQGNMEIIDLINEGNIGLMRAIERYDVSMGYKFSTYATPWIKHYMRKAVINNSSVIKIPRNIYNIIREFKREVDRLEMQYERSLTKEEIATSLSMPIEEVQKIYGYMYMYHTISLDQPINEEEDMAIKDLFPSDENIEDLAIENTLKDEIQLLFDNLTEREQAVIKMRYGIGEYNNKEYQLTEIAKKLSVSVERVRQTEYKAMIKLRKFANNNKSLNSLKVYVK